MKKLKKLSSENFQLLHVTVLFVTLLIKVKATAMRLIPSGVTPPPRRGRGCGLAASLIHSQSKVTFQKTSCENDRLQRLTVHGNGYCA
jgi:hypothetical protein